MSDSASSSSFHPAVSGRDGSSMDIVSSAGDDKEEKKEVDEEDVEEGSDVDEDELLASASAAPKQRSKAASSSSSQSSMSAVDRLNALLEQTEQFASYVKKGAGGAADDRSSSSSSSAAERSRRSHLDAKEKEEDAALIEDELEEETQHQPHYTRLLEQPASVQGEMRDYQLEALNWLIRLHEQNINGILADEMGLGKTLECLSLLSYLKAYRGLPGPHLIIVPKSTSSNWMREIGRWTPNLSCAKFHGSQQEREVQKRSLGQQDVTVTTYEMVIREKAALRRVQWHYLVIDEAHRIKNEHSLLATVVRTLPSSHRLLITGTPLQNSLHELWALLNFLVPAMFDAAADFEQWFDITGSGSGEAEGEKLSMVSRLHRILRPFLLRRLKSDVEATLLPKVETNLYVGLSAMQRLWYTKVLSREVEVLNADVKGKTGKLRLLNIVMQLRKVCNHPYLFQSAEPGPPYTEGEHLIENSGKMILLDKLLSRLRANGHRCLIFSQMTRLLDILEDYMRWRNYEYRRIDGQTKQEERDDAMDEFNAPNSPIFCFLLSTRAGGLGINLQTADTVILYDSDWNPQMDLQAQDRAHRIGQRRQVRVFRFVTEDSIEQKIVERAMKKLLLDALVIKQGRLAEADRALDASELQEMVRFGASRIFSASDSLITDADIDVILEEGREKTERERAKLKDVAGVGAGDLLSFSISADGRGEKNMMEFEGKDYSSFRPGRTAGLEFINLPQRGRKEAKNYSEAAYYREALRIGEAKAKGGKREYRPAQRLDFQFFDPRLEELEKKEFEAEQRYRELKSRRDEERREKRRQDKERVKEEKRWKRLQKSREVLSAAGGAEGGAGGGAADDGGSEEEAGDEASRASPSPSPPPPSEAGDGADGKKSSKQAQSRSKRAKEEAEEAATAGGGEEDGEEEDEELRRQAGWLTAEEEAEKAELEAAGFGDWQRKHFNGYIRAVERFGRDAEREIADSGLVEGKSAKEVRAYHAAFLEQHGSIAGWEALISRIEKGEARRERLQHIQQLIDAKVKKHRRPLDTLSLSYPTAQRLYTLDEDRFLLCCLHKLGWGQWEEIKAEVRLHFIFRFDWFLKSRSSAELQKRAEYLCKIIEREREEEEEKKKHKAKGGKGAAAAAGRGSQKKAATASRGQSAGAKRKHETAKSSSSSSKKKRK